MSEQLVIGSVSRLVKQKRVADLVGAAPNVLEQFPNAHFLVTGDGPTSVQLAEQVSDLGLGKSFTFTGTVKDTENLYPALDVFAQTADREGFGLSMAEAMASGTSVVAADTGAIPELVQDGHNGLLYAVGDIPALTEKICSLLGDTETRRRLGRQATQDIAENFPIGAVPQKYRELWGSLLAGNRHQ